MILILRRNSEFSTILRKLSKSNAMKAEFQHQSLSTGRWFEFTLAEQLGNIGSEVSRTIRARGDEKRFNSAVSRARELFCAAVLGSSEYGTSFEDLDRYFYYFAFAARSKR